MALKVETQIAENVFILRCEGRIIFGDEGAVLPPEGQAALDRNAEDCG
jgi:hypothetical protein